MIFVIRDFTGIGSPRKCPRPYVYKGLCGLTSQNPSVTDGRTNTERGIRGGTTAETHTRTRNSIQSTRTGFAPPHSNYSLVFRSIRQIIYWYEEAPGRSFFLRLDFHEIPNSMLGQEFPPLHSAPLPILLYPSLLPLILTQLSHPPLWLFSPLLVCTMSTPALR